MLNRSSHNLVFKHSIRHKMTPIFCIMAIGWYLLENWSNLINEEYFKLGLSIIGVASFLAIAAVFKYQIVINERHLSKHSIFSTKEILITDIKYYDVKWIEYKGFRYHRLRLLSESQKVLITIPFTVSPWDKLLSWAETNFKSL